MKNKGKMKGKIETNGNAHMVTRFLLLRWGVDFYCTDPGRRRIESPSHLLPGPDGPVGVLSLMKILFLKFQLFLYVYDEQ